MPKKNNFPSSNGVNRPLHALVDEYNATYRNDRKNEFHQWWSKADSLSQAIRKAVKSQQEDGTRHPHQRRLKSATLAQLQDFLFAREEEISSANGFSELYEIVAAGGEAISGIGSVTVFDVSLRIAAYTEKPPTMVYLHAGALKGYKKLGLPGTPHVTTVDAFPKPIQALSAQEIEDFLCVYKNELRDHFK